MFSRLPIVKSSFPSSVHRLFITQRSKNQYYPNLASSSWFLGFSSGENSWDRNSAFYNLLARYISSGVLISTGSTLGFCCYLSSDHKSLVAYSDASHKIPAGEELHSLRPDQSFKFIFGDAYRSKIFFNYEKRIRTQSPPEKVFEYFASVKTPEGEILMTPADLMRAVVPVFPPSESNRVREGSLRGERAPGELYCAPSKFFMLFDTNNDGLISFADISAVSSAFDPISIDTLYY